MPKKIRVGVLCGGRSAEHEVSLQSAKNVVDAIDKSKYEVVLIGIDKAGRWALSDPGRLAMEAAKGSLPAITRSDADETVTLVPQASGTGQLVRSGDSAAVEALDVVFPVLHGTYGEDGTVQGLLKLANVPYVGAGVLGSSVGMDKDVMKRLLRDAGLPGPRFVTVAASQRNAVDYADVVAEVGEPSFVKPANLGSSVGVHKATDAASFKAALDDAFTYDLKVLVEEAIDGREIECSVLGNEEPIASVLGEVIPTHDFYSYEAKYLDENGALLKIPADLPEGTVERVQELAVRAFQVLCCEGMARADFFLRGEDEVLINEINTIPGFTKISMYPKLWEASGIGYTDLIDRLIQLALDRHEKENRLRTSYDG